MFPQLGAPIGLLLSGGTFLLLSDLLTNDQFFEYGWRIPFIASSLLVGVGFYIRLKITETPSFVNAKETKKEVKVPLFSILKSYKWELIFGTFAAVATFVTFYLMTVFSLSWATTDLGYSRRDFLIIELYAILFFVLGIPFSAVIADRFGRKNILLIASALIAVFGLSFSFFMDSGSTILITTFICLGMGLMGLTYGPLGTYLSELFPTEVRYSGSSLTFNLAGILGASFAPLIAIWLATKYGISFVGYYLTLAALISFVAILAIRKKEEQF
jgi:MFS family permease